MLLLFQISPAHHEIISISISLNNSPAQSKVCTVEIRKQTPVIHSPASTLPLLEISYSPVSDLSSDFFDDLFPSSSPPVSSEVTTSDSGISRLTYYPLNSSCST
ncbi:hypothetical protein ALC53_00302 [Atta colombica]|uniref:Uncharacterized protein n=1 Tax=Atta colombica TaxID=520822 RepID=A0A195BXP8_9HYME|nr:hypothetical protein ALC53_00302 [Atta colombica]